MSNVDEILSQLREALKDELRQDNDFRAEILSELSAQLSGGARPQPAKKISKKAPGKAPPPSLKVKAGERRGEHQFEAARAAVLAYLKSKPGSRVDQMAADIGVTVKDLQLPISQLLKAKRLKKAGRLRGTTYTVRG